MLNPDGEPVTGYLGLGQRLGPRRWDHRDASTRCPHRHVDEWVGFRASQG